MDTVPMQSLQEWLPGWLVSPVSTVINGRANSNKLLTLTQRTMRSKRGQMRAKFSFHYSVTPNSTCSHSRAIPMTSLVGAKSWGPIFPTPEGWPGSLKLSFLTLQVDMRAGILLLHIAKLVPPDGDWGMRKHTPSTTTVLSPGESLADVYCDCSHSQHDTW